MAAGGDEFPREPEPANAGPRHRVLVVDDEDLVRRVIATLLRRSGLEVIEARWLFDVVENYLLDHDTDLLAFLIILPSADPPDAPTRQENTDRMRKIRRRMRMLVTVPIGNAFKANLVRAVMRGLNFLLGQSDTRSIADTVDDGLDALLENASARTPPARQIREDLGVIYQALGEPVPKFPSIHPGRRSDPD